MTWAKQPGAAAKYRTKEHTDTRKRLMAQLKAAGQGQCAETVCVYTSRVIYPTDDLHLCHTTDGQAILGMGHALCNVKAAAREARSRQNPRRSRDWYS